MPNELFAWLQSDVKNPQITLKKTQSDSIKLAKSSENAMQHAPI